MGKQSKKQANEAASDEKSSSKKSSAKKAQSDDALSLSVSVGAETLEGTPTRVLTFLRAAGTVVPIRAALQSKGYSTEEHALGWELLHKVSGFVSGGEEQIDNGVSEAIKTLDAWDEDGFRIIRAALTHRHPEQAKFVLRDLSASVGPQAVIGVKILLDRLDALESATDRVATRAADQAALETLSKRGITKAERARLRALVEKAQSFTATPKSDESKKSQDYDRSLVELRAWFEEWSEIARAVIKRRDYLIRLGLAKRKGKEKKKDEPTP